MADTRPVNVKVYIWDAARSRARPPAPLDLHFEGPVYVPACGPDQERKEVQRAVGQRFGKRIRGCSSLVGGGYAVNLDPVREYP